MIRSEFFTADCRQSGLSQTGFAYHIEKRDDMASTKAPSTRVSHKRLKPKPKTESKSWQTRNTARKEKQTAHAAKLAAETGR